MFDCVGALSRVPLWGSAFTLCQGAISVDVACGFAHVSFHRGGFDPVVKRVGLLPVLFPTPLCRFKTDILPEPILRTFHPIAK